MMSGKPFAVIETDGHSGDRHQNRVEAFLYCVREDTHRTPQGRPCQLLETFEAQKPKLLEIRDAEEILLVPYMSLSHRMPGRVVPEPGGSRRRVGGPRPRSF